MARYKPVDRSLRFVAVDPAAQILPGSFEHALCTLIDEDIELDGFAARFKNDAVGAPGYDPAVLLKIVLLAYSKGIVRSRDIEALCRQNVLFNCVSGCRRTRGSAPGPMARCARATAPTTSRPRWPAPRA